LKAIFADLQKQQAESGREVVNLSRQPDLAEGGRGQKKDLNGDLKDVSYYST
jgi:hypothetical protein